jgi:hypothetical protein
MRTLHNRIPQNRLAETLEKEQQVQIVTSETSQSSTDTQPPLQTVNASLTHTKHTHALSLFIFSRSHNIIIITSHFDSSSLY